MSDLPYTERDIDDVEWAVWFGRKNKGKSRDVARRILDQNPALRISEVRADLVGRIETAVAGLSLSIYTVGGDDLVRLKVVLAAIQEEAKRE